jgi:hypothetical protein
MVDSKRIIVKDSVPFPFIILAPAPLSVYTRNMCIVYTCIPALYMYSETVGCSTRMKKVGLAS